MTSRTSSPGQGFDRDGGIESSGTTCSRNSSSGCSATAPSRAPPARCVAATSRAVLDLSLEDALTGGRHRLSLGDGHSVTVNIPAGVREGQRIRVAGQGAQGRDGGPAGDLYLLVRLKPHPRFRRQGEDLQVDVRVAPWDAALGATVPVSTLTGTAQVRVPAGSSSGRRLRLRGRGLPTGGGERGNLYATVPSPFPSSSQRRSANCSRSSPRVLEFSPREGRR